MGTINTRLLAGSSGMQRGRGIMPYPHPAFDLSSYYMPTTVKSLFRWCLYVYTNNPVMYAAMRKKAAYVINDNIYDARTEDIKELYRRLFDNVLNIKKIKKKVYYDIQIYGNSFVSIIFPMDRWLVCETCGIKSPLKSFSRGWTYKQYAWYGHCRECNKTQKHKSEMRPVKTLSRVKLKIWHPKDIAVKVNPFTGTREYLYQPPPGLKKMVEDSRVNQVYVEDTPDEILQAIQEDKLVKLDRDNVYYFAADCPSHDDEAFAVPPLLHTFKLSWLAMMYNKADEAIAAEHVLPLTLLIPRENSSGKSPHMNADLYSWQSRMRGVIQRWKQDQNSIHMAPFPVDIENVRGDAKVLNVDGKLEYIRQNIIASQDLPIQLLTGDMQYSGAMVNLRILENLFRDHISDFDAFQTNFLLPSLKAFFGLPECTITSKDFKMADDVQQKQIALSLRTSNLVSDKAIVEQLGFDYPKEEYQKTIERRKRLQDLSEQQMHQHTVQAQAQQLLANANGKAQITQSIYQALSQKAAQKVLGGSDGNEDIKKQIDLIVKNTKSNVTDMTNYFMDSYKQEESIHRWFKEVPDSLKAFELSILKKSNPVMAQAIAAKMKEVEAQEKNIKPLSEQKPPRGTASGMNPGGG